MIIRKILRFTLRLILVTLVLLILVLLIGDRFVQFRMDDAALTKFFGDKHVPVHINYYNSHGRAIRYATTGTDTSATILFIHGAPGSLSYYKDYLTDSTLLTKATMFSVDRPGYGYSGLAKPVPYVEEQARIISPIIDSLHKLHHPLIIVAASYGTAIACRITMDHPELVDGLILVGPALAPGEEKMLWFTPAIEYPVLQWVVPRMLQSANTEKLHHKEELQKLLPLWQNIHVPVIYLQGANDGLVYTTNADFARKQLTNVPFLEINMVPGRGHLLVNPERALIEQKIIKMLSILKQGNTK
jgi:pimeloyl-ACP methyl ester carboxylesterase